MCGFEARSLSCEVPTIEQEVPQQFRGLDSGRKAGCWSGVFDGGKRLRGTCPVRSWVRIAHSALERFCVQGPNTLSRCLEANGLKLTCAGGAPPGLGQFLVVCCLASAPRAAELRGEAGWSGLVVA